MNRRNFIKALSAVLAVIPTGWLAAFNRNKPFELIGDGIHDDTEAMQALFDGNPVLCKGEIYQASGDTVFLPPGTFSVSEVVLTNPQILNIVGAPDYETCFYSVSVT